MFVRFDKIESALPFLTGNHFSNTKDTTVTKEKHKASRLFSPFVYFVSFVVRLFAVDYGTPIESKRPDMSCLRDGQP